jgi:hypothetical protein
MAAAVTHRYRGANLFRNEISARRKRKINMAKNSEGGIGHPISKILKEQNCSDPLQTSGKIALPDQQML